MRRFVVYRQVLWRCEVCDPLEKHNKRITCTIYQMHGKTYAHTHTHTIEVVKVVE